MNYLWKNLNHLIFFCKLAQEEQVSSVPLVNISVLFRRRRGFFTWKVPEKTSELSCYSISSACSTLRVQNSSMTTDIMRNCLHLFFSSPFMSPSVSHNSPWPSADLWWCFSPSCSYPTLLFPGLAPSVQ